MMDLFKNTKVVGGAVIIAVVLFGAYYYWGGSSSSATITQTESPASQDLLTTLANLHSIKLDPGIFSDPLFTSLTDFGVTIPPQPTGRRNPFAPPSGFTSQTQTPPSGH